MLLFVFGGVAVVAAFFLCFLLGWWCGQWWLVCPPLHWLLCCWVVFWVLLESDLVRRVALGLKVSLVGFKS